MIPIFLLVFFSLIDELIRYGAGWFQLLGRILILWAVGALINGLLRETLTRGLIPAASTHGSDIYRPARWVLFYILLGIAAFWGAEVFSIREDILALLRFAVSVTIVVALYLLLLKKEALLSLLPSLSYRSYQGFVRYLKKYYHPLVGFSFIVALLWCLGYKNLGKVILTKIWASAGAFVALMLIYIAILGWLRQWSRRVDPMDEAAGLLIRSLRVLLLYANITLTVIIVLNLLGLLSPLQRVMSFPVFELGATQVTFWTILKAILILLAFVFGSRLLQAYFDYKVYPAVGIDPGLGYALNTFLKYVTIAAGLLVSLRVVGIDLRFLLVFAGALGIGIGLGLQNIARLRCDSRNLPTARSTLNC